jgi:hypothetical protein
MAQILDLHKTIRKKNVHVFKQGFTRFLKYANDVFLKEFFFSSCCCENSLWGLANLLAPWRVSCFLSDVLNEMLNFTFGSPKL